MERVLYNIHSQVCGAALRQTSTKTRSVLEWGILLMSVSMFGVLFVSHVSFVYREGLSQSIPATCLSSIPNFSNKSDLFHISLLENSTTSRAFHLDATNQTCDHLHSQSHNKIQFSFSRQKGLLLLDSSLLTGNPSLNITTQIVEVGKHDVSCFGEPFLQRIVSMLVGTDTIIINWLLVLGNGYIYEPTTQTMIESYRTHHLSLWRTSPFPILVWKLGVVASSLFLFFITTTLTSFTLGETQQRMLEFTLQLQQHVRERRFLGRLIFMHVMESLVFVPIMVGMMFFLIEFYGGDKLLAFMVFSWVWICETFSVVSLRSVEGLRFFPKIFFLLFLGFHIYFFSCPFGFHHMALAATVAFLLHSMLFFWNRYELPAIAHGLITIEHPRMSSTETTPNRPSTSRPFMPHLDSTTTDSTELQLDNRTNGNMGRRLEPRMAESYPSMSTLGQMSQPIFQADSDDDSSFVYMLNGEVILPARVAPSQRVPPTETTMTTTPRRGSSDAAPAPISPPQIVSVVGPVDNITTRETLTPRTSNPAVSPG